MTDLIASQTTAEAWVIGDGDTIVSQVLAEAWVRNTPITFLVSSQAVLEVWGNFPVTVPPTPSVTRVHRVASQVL